MNDTFETMFRIRRSLSGNDLAHYWSASITH